MRDLGTLSAAQSVEDFAPALPVIRQWVRSQTKHMTRFGHSEHPNTRRRAAHGAVTVISPSIPSALGTGFPSGSDITTPVTRNGSVPSAGEAISNLHV